MGRPYFRGVILRDHGTERPEGLPTMGTAPKTQKLTRCKKKTMTSGRVVPTFSSLFSGYHRQGHKTDKVDHIQHIIQYCKQEAQRRRHPTDTETRKNDFQRAPRGGGPDPPFPAFLRKKRGLAKKNVDNGEKSKENSKKARIALFLKGQKNKIPAFFAKKRGFSPKKRG